MPSRRLRPAIPLILILALTAGAAFAQVQTGSLYGAVNDEQSNPLAGAAVNLTGVGAPQRQTTDASGKYRFLGLSPGAYQLRVELEGFSTVEQPNVVIGIGRNTTVDVLLNSAVEDVITVTAESPLLDERRITSGTSISAVELEKVPTARDPWSLLNQTPGVMVDRINVGGNESGQQSVFVGRGSNSDAVTWAVDGVDITDMSSLSSPTYFDFDAFEELQLTTGGSDVTMSTAGVTVNVVTRRGTNEWRGSGRYFLTDGSNQSDPDISGGDAGRNNNGPGGSLRVQDLSTFVPNSIDEVVDEGLEIGGPVLRDRLWIWGAYGDNDIKNVVAGGQVDRTILENLNGKINAQIGQANSATAQWSRGDKIKDGRGAGATRSPETTTDQSGPTETTKVEDTHIFGSNFYLTGLYSLVDGGFALSPKGGLDADIYLDANGVYHGSYYFLDNDRDVTQYRLEGSSFFGTGAVSHELKFGAGYRKFENSSLFGYSNQKQVRHCANFGCPAGFDTDVVFIRDSNTALSIDYKHLWLQDTLSWSNLTANLGLRYQQESGENGATAVPGVIVGGTTIFPDLSFSGNDPGFDWTTIQPRLGITYALGAERKTLLRGNLSRFVEQLGSGYISNINPVATSLGYGFFNDANGNTVLDPGEVGSVFIPPSGYSGFDPNNPTSLSSTHQVDPGLEPATTDELGLSVEHSLLPEFVVGASATLRHVSDIIDAQFLVNDNGTVRVAQLSDWVPESGVVAGQPVNYFVLRQGVSGAGGRFITNGDREQDYLGLALTFNKRLANRWMMRGNVSWNDWTWDVPSSFFGPNDPTDFGDGPGVPGLGDAAAGDRDGEIVAERSGGSGLKGNVYLNSEWSLNVNGLYQIAPDRRWGFNLGGNLSARQGYPSPHFLSRNGSDGITRRIAASGVDEFRNDDVMTLDLRLDKELIFGPVSTTLSFDLFNVFNDNTVLQRERNQGSQSANFVRETISPRVLRLGLRLGWN